MVPPILVGNGSVSQNMFNKFKSFNNEPIVLEHACATNQRALHNMFA